MNKFNLNKRLGAMLSVALMALTLAGCGSDDGAQNGGIGGGGIPGTVINGTTVNADGSRTISFSGTTDRVTPTRILIGSLPASTGNMACASGFACFQKAFCRMHGYTGMGCSTTEGFEVLGQTFGSLGLGAVAAVGGASVQKPDKAYYQVDGGRTNVAIAVSGWYGGSATVSGVINLSPQYVQYELGGQNVVSLGLDIYPQSGNVGGVIFTLVNSASGSFIAF